MTPDVELFGEGPLIPGNQGNVGNCALIAAIASLSEFPNHVKENIFLTKAGLSRVSRAGVLKHEFGLFETEYCGKLSRTTSFIMYSLQGPYINWFFCGEPVSVCVGISHAFHQQ